MSEVKLREISRRIVSCTECDRLREYCRGVAEVKRRQFQNEVYWGKPVPGFGDPDAKILIVGLAPAAHGANRTGRMFTGDQSGLWLYRAIHKAGFSNQGASFDRNDGLRLNQIFITAIARCAPPENKPLPEEIKACSKFLKAEIEALPRIQVILALGQIALKGIWAILPDEIKQSRVLPKFSHGAEMGLKDGKMILCSYHPSQQNTFTRKLTEPMFDEIFVRAKNFLQTE